MNTAAVKTGDEMRYQSYLNHEKSRRIMKQRNKSRIGAIASAFLLSGALYGTFYSNRAQADLAQDVESFTQAVGNDSALLLSFLTSRVREEVTRATGGAADWTADTIRIAFDNVRDVKRIADSRGIVMVDALIPSVQGCVSSTDGSSMEAVTVIGVPSKGGDVSLPMVATTQGRGIPATIFGVPVPIEILSEEQQSRWGVGCYWMPMPPGMYSVVAGTRGTETRFLKISPMAVGFDMTPAAKWVSLTNGEVFISETDEVFARGNVSESTSGTVD